jgi:hypothetical protein
MSGDIPPKRGAQMIQRFKLTSAKSIVQTREPRDPPDVAEVDFE